MNSPQPPPRLPWSERVHPRSWPLPVKLIAVVVVPALFAITLGTLRVLDQSAVAADFDRVDRVAALQEQYSRLTVELQNEREQAVQFVAVRDRRDPAPFEAATQRTEAARTAASNLLSGRSDLNGGTLGALRQVDNNYFRLTQLRRQVLAGANDAADLFTQYNVVVDPLLVFDSALTRQLSNPEFSGLSQAIGALVEAREQVAAQQTLVTAVLEAGTLPAVQADALRAADARLITATSTVRSVLSDEQKARYTGFAGPIAATREQLKQSVVDRGRANLPIDLSSQQWHDASVAVLSEIDNAESGARLELRAISAAQQEAASNRAGVSSVFLLLALMACAGIVYLVAKALVGSLRTLRSAALDVANRRLPEAVQSMREGTMPNIDVTPVPVSTREEIGQVARAFDAVHSQAVRLAAEQATLQSNVSSMFANLSRRSQALAERQLKLIEQLESNEQDPDQLANLFHLDSLATRMRRNSENLLVLSGTDVGKRATRPVPVVDVLRAAVSEVEQYQRVIVQSPPDATVAGRAASDIVHLLAELVDNATNFSAPDTQVIMSSQRTPDGSVLIEIVDRGVGMDDDELTDANQRLARPTALDVSVSRRMGLFVVGRLAARHGLGVRLGGGSSTGGTTASVTVPGYLVTPAPGSEGTGTPTQSGTPGQAGVSRGQELVPSPRAGLNGASRSISLSALVAGSDAPADTPSGSSTVAQTRQQTGTSDPESVGLPHTPGTPESDRAIGVARTNGAGQSVPRASEQAPEQEPPAVTDSEKMPRRRPGQFLGQAPSVAPPTTAAGPTAAGPTAEPPSRPKPSAAESPDGSRHTRPQPSAERASERSGSQAQAPRPASAPASVPEPGPATETFPAQQPAPTEPEPAQPSSAKAESGQRGQKTSTSPGSATPPGRSQPQPGFPAPAGPSTPQVRSMPPAQPAQPSRPAQPAQELPQRRPAQPVRQQGEPSSPSLPSRLSAQARQKPQQGPRTDLPTGSAPRPQPAAGPSPDRAEPSAPRAQGSPRTTAALFAPKAAGSEPPRSTPPRSAAAEPAVADPPSETTPIFEEIASAWFRADRQVPIDFDVAASEASPSPAAPKAATPARRPAPSTRSAAQPARSDVTADADPVPAPEPSQATATSGARRQAAGRPPTAPSSPSAQPASRTSAEHDAPLAFATAADDGWRASAAASEAGGDDLTQAGLPKRRPRARLVPGAAPTTNSGPAANPVRTAETIRGRLASYQNGVRQGREVRMRRSAGPAGSTTTTTATPNAAANGHSTDNRDEEIR